jgi:hypothetical protein
MYYTDNIDAKIEKKNTAENIKQVKKFTIYFS